VTGQSQADYVIAPYPWETEEFPQIINELLAATSSKSWREKPRSAVDDGALC
jgi:hypothetical protein